MGCAEEIEEMLEIKVYKIGGQQEIFTFEAWRRLFDINEKIYTELCHEFYSTYTFDEVCVDDELGTKRVIKFKLRGSGHTLTLLEFAQRLRLYHADEVNDEGFEVYFQGELCSDENFKVRDYWLSISSEEELHFSRSLASTIRHPILRVLQNMITYGFIMRIARRMGLLTDEVLNSLSAPIYCRALDAITLKELIGLDGRLIAEDPAPEGTLERMARRQSYHSDRYASLFEYMAEQYQFPLQGNYAPPGYDEDDEE
ncbi:hypothetical protein Tco_0682525 [Tanacetum coccineum]|uniref:Uncharacterized protein n=1 Tax=Tanacetum coccineum TaxID=301880 RepID=A0ABQ4XT03_9ASTR